MRVRPRTLVNKSLFCLYSNNSSLFLLEAKKINKINKRLIVFLSQLSVGKLGFLSLFIKTGETLPKNA